MKIPQAPLLSRSFRMLDVEFEVRSDSREIINLFGAALPRFAAQPLGVRPLRFIVLAHPGGQRSPVIDLDGRTFKVRRADLLPNVAFMKVMREVYTRVGSHLLVHAAAVARDKAGLIFPASSSAGKTTLALRLVMDGWSFLSDDLAALEPDTGSMTPLPRSLGIRHGTLVMLGLDGMDDVGRLPYITGGQKRLFDADSIRPGCVATGGRLSHLILLSLPDGGEGMRFRDGLFSIVVDRADEGFIADLLRIPGVEGVDVDGEDLIDLGIRHSSAALVEGLEGLAENHNVMIFDRKYEEVPAVPRFDGRPTLRPLGTAEAARELARSFLGGPRSKLLRERFGGSVASMVFELAGILEGVQCHRMTVGDLEEMVRLVYDVV